MFAITTVHHVNDVDMSDPNVQYMGRKIAGHNGYFGNPFYRKPNESLGVTLEKFTQFFYDCLELDAEYRDRIHALEGKKLACWCRTKKCHAQVVADYLNARRLRLDQT